MTPGGLTPIRFKPLTSALELDTTDNSDRSAPLLDINSGVGRYDGPAV